MLESVPARCPYCGEPVELVIDTSLPEQTYIEDCEVCCRPMAVTARVASDGTPSVEVHREDE